MTQSTYHSFNDVELFEPNSPPRANTEPSMRQSPRKPTTADSTSNRISRQDSGYESVSSPRTSTSPSSRTVTSSQGHARRISNASATRSRPRTRRSTTAKTVPVPHHLSSRPSGYFHFPQHPSDITAPPQPAVPISPFEIEDRSLTVSPPPLPPQTTHYWTSDSTRRLEYAAIDASCRGVKGWVRRNIVPGCMGGGSEGGKHVAFDDDTGSVRRYRLELEEGEETEKEVKGKRKGWLWRKMTV